MNNVDLVCLQHEYGIFGGDNGAHILTMLRELKMPVVTTFHSILKSPSQGQFEVMHEISQLSDRLISMTRKGREFLEEIYEIPRHKIDLIPHGIHSTHFADPNFYKDQLNVEGKTVLLTFGLLAANKGIEYAIRALPKVVQQYPDVVYIVLGATHPNVLREQGDIYRDSLQEEIKQLGLEENVLFLNEFVPLEKLTDSISAADIYITPYLHEEQVVSGSLAYAVGAGKPVISTPYWHAVELLSEGCGLLVPFRDSDAMAEKILFLLDNEDKRHAIRKRVYLNSREMVWSQVAKRYMSSFIHAKELRFDQPRPAPISGKGSKDTSILPSLNLDHLHRLTDCRGIMQHAIFSVPRLQDGYSTDDNARALIAAVKLEHRPEYHDASIQLAACYLAALWYAFNSKTQRFRNLMSFDGRWLDDSGSEDSHGRAMWALGVVLGKSKSREHLGMAGTLFEMGLPACAKIGSPRSMAFILMGINEYLKSFGGDQKVLDVRGIMARKLVYGYEQYHADNWPWFEQIVAYCNAKLPHALLITGSLLEDDQMIDIGLESLTWLSAIQTAHDGHFFPIGSDGFYPKGGVRARFAQQPIEAYSAIAATIEAYNITGDESWLNETRRAFQWFLGRNDLNLSVYNPRTGGCHDGLDPEGVNQNEGAESTLAFILSWIEIEQLIRHDAKAHQRMEDLVESHRPASS
jgi:glycosyltransferase involved in cell wall biosynthesis